MSIQHLPPKEKALELFNSMKGFKVKHSHSLKCAIKAVDEILKELEPIAFFHELYKITLTKYWEDVRAELLVLKNLAK